MPSTQLVCGACGAKNRVPIARLTERPLCGRCSSVLSTSSGSTQRPAPRRSRSPVLRAYLLLGLVVCGAAFIGQTTASRSDRARHVRQDAARVAHQESSASKSIGLVPEEAQFHQRLNASDVYRNARPSVLHLHVSRIDGAEISASGFVIEAGIFATNFHVVKGMKTGLATLVGTSTSSPFRVVKFADEDADVAVCLMDRAIGVPLSLVIRRDPAIGETVYVLSNPQSLEGTFVSGMISSLRLLKGAKILQHTAPVAPGSSGGPVLDEYCRVVGMITSGIPESQGLNFAVSSRAISDVMSRKRTVSLQRLRAVDTDEGDAEVAQGRYRAAMTGEIDPAAGGIRLTVRPSGAKVFDASGAYLGRADPAIGVAFPPGPYRLSIVLDGYRKRRVWFNVRASEVYIADVVLRPEH